MPTTGRPLAAEEVIRLLDLVPHPEGGFYRETYRDRPQDGGRGASTAIYYLLMAGQVSAWHRVTDAAEVWHHYAGGALELTLSVDGRETTVLHLGIDLEAGERPQVTVPAGVWQTAEPAADRAVLVGCVVSPGFDFADFSLAEPQ